MAPQFRYHPLFSRPPPILSKASSITTEFPRMTCASVSHYPDSTAVKSSTNHHPQSNLLSTLLFLYSIVQHDVQEHLKIPSASCFTLHCGVEHTSYPLKTPMTFLLPFNCTKSRLSRYCSMGSVHLSFLSFLPSRLCRVCCFVRYLAR
jgi:hypothetical protein